MAGGHGSLATASSSTAVGRRWQCQGRWQPSYCQQRGRWMCQLCCSSTAAVPAASSTSCHHRPYPPHPPTSGRCSRVHPLSLPTRTPAQTGHCSQLHRPSAPASAPMHAPLHQSVATAPGTSPHLLRRRGSPFYPQNAPGRPPPLKFAPNPNIAVPRPPQEQHSLLVPPGPYSSTSSTHSSLPLDDPSPGNKPHHCKPVEAARALPLPCHRPRPTLPTLPRQQ